MIKIEIIYDGKLQHTFSDAGMPLLQVETGLVYDDAIDVIPCRYTYQEINAPTEGELI